MTNEIDFLKKRTELYQGIIANAQIVIAELQLIVKNLEQGTSK